MSGSRVRLDDHRFVKRTLIVSLATAVTAVGMLSETTRALAQLSSRPSKSSADKLYEKAKAELPGNLYTSYRLLDRIISANVAITQKASIAIRSLDEASCKGMLGNSPICSLATELPDIKKEDSFLVWALQVAGSSSAAPNAYATSLNNRIILNKSLDDAFSEDLEAKACVIAHEVAHIQQDHSKLRMKAIAGWNVQAAGKISSAVKNAHSAQKSGNFWTTLAVAANAVSAGLNSGMGNYGAAASANLDNQMLVARMQAENEAGRMLVGQLLQVAQQQAPEIFNALQGMQGLSARYVQRTMKDVDMYLNEVSEKAFELSRQQEFEADQLAVAYMARAGINPEGCLRVISKLHRGQYRPFASKSDTHPGEQERTEKLQAAIEANAINYRRAKSQLVKPAPLSYQYDDKLEIVTVLPRGTAQNSNSSNAGAAVDGFLGK